MAGFIQNLFSGKWGGAAGDKDDAGILGVGQYKAPTVAIDKTAFAPNANIEAQRLSFGQQLAASQNRAAPTVSAATVGPAAQMTAAQLSPAERAQAATIDQTQQAQFRRGQTDLVSALQAQAAGQGPSLAQNQLQRATDRNLAQALALGATQRGSNPGAAQRQIAMQTAQVNAQAGRDAADLRIQEQLAARQQLGAALAQARQQDIGLATDQAGLTQQTGMFNADAGNRLAVEQGKLMQQAGLANQDATNTFALRQADMNQQVGLANQRAALEQAATNDAMARFYNQGLMGAAQADRDAAIQAQQLAVNQNNALAGVNASAYGDASKRRGSAVAGLGQALGFLGGGGGGMFGGGGGRSANDGGPTANQSVKYQQGQPKDVAPDDEGFDDGGYEDANQSGMFDDGGYNYGGDGTGAQMGPPDPYAGSSSGASRDMAYDEAPDSGFGLVGGTRQRPTFAAQLRAQQARPQRRPLTDAEQRQLFALSRRRTA